MVLKLFKICIKFKKPFENLNLKKFFLIKFFNFLILDFILKKFA